MGLGESAGVGIDVGGQVIEEVPDHADVLGSDLPARLGGGGGRQLRFQRLAGDRVAGAEITGLGQPAPGVSAADAQPLTQNRRPGLRAQIDSAGPRLQLAQQRVFHSGLAAALDFQPMQNLQCLPRPQSADGQRGQLVPAPVKVLQDGQHRLDIRRPHLHESNTSSMV